MLVTLVVLVLIYFYVHQYYLEWKYSKLYPNEINNYLQRNRLKLVISRHLLTWDLEILHQKMEAYKK